MMMIKEKVLFFSLFNITVFQEGGKKERYAVQ